MAAFKCERPVTGDPPNKRTMWETARAPFVAVRAIAPGERDTWTESQTEAWDNLVEAGIVLVASFDSVAVK